MHKSSLSLGIFFAMTSVILGAFGAHYLKTIFTPELLQSFETGVKYQMYHGLALIALGIYAGSNKKGIQPIFISFLLGTLLFSGSIYILCMLKSNLQIGLGGLGILTPIGGIALIVGWGIWLVQIIKSPKNEAC